MLSAFDLLFNLLRMILFWWVRTEKIEKDYSTWQLNDNKTVFYVLENRSLADALVVDQVTRELGFPPLSDRIELEKGTKERAFFSVHNRKSRLFSNKPGIAPRLGELLRYLEKHPDQKILIVPVTLIWGRGPIIKKSLFKVFFSDTWGVTGRLKKLITVILNGRSTYVEFNTPILLNNLKDSSNNVEISARKVARVLRVHFRRSKSRVIGPDLSHRRVLLNQILRTPEVAGAISQHAISNNISTVTVNKIAKSYGEEIAASLSFTIIRLMDILLTRLWNKIYNGIEVANIKSVRKLAKTHEIIYAPCHRSHIDYLLLSYCLYHRGLNVPHIAAGINLNMPVIGSILRRGGAFFMRRSFKGNKLYAAVFNEYIHQVFAHGHPVEYFVEGGRSRTGKMMQPKAGMLSMTVKSYIRDSNRPFAIIPVYIGYEKVFEDRTYLHELRGKEKRSESVFGLVKTLKKLKNFGKVALNFGEPILLGQFLDQHQPSWKSTSQEERPGWLIPTTDKLAKQLVTNINAAAALNPVNLVACVILSSSQQAICEGTLLNQLELLIQLLDANPYSNNFTLPQGTAVDWVLDVEAKGWLIRHQQGDSEALFSMETDNAVLMTYYRNNVSHLFALPALVCSLFNNEPRLRKKEAIDIISKVYPYLKAELFLPWDENQIGQQVESWLTQLRQLKIIQKNAGGYYSAYPADTLNRSRMSLLAQLILPTMERYFLTLAILNHEGSGNSTASEIELESQIVAHRISILNGLNSPEFFDKLLFRQFVSTLRNRSIIATNEQSKITFDHRIAAIMQDAHKAISQNVIMTITQILNEYRKGNQD